MKISNDLIFLDNNEDVIIYNYFTNRSVMVDKDTAFYIKSNIGMAVKDILLKENTIKILDRNGILINDEIEYLNKKFRIENKKMKINSVYFHVTQRCNLNCIYCYNKENLNNKDELSEKQIEVILNKLFNFGVKTINFTGGEALIRDDILEIIKKAKRLKFKICLLSNGTLLNKKLEVLDYIDECIISMDDIEIERNCVTRKGMDKYNVLQMLQNLSVEHKEKISVRSVIMRGMENSIERNKSYFEKLGINYMVSLCLPNNKDEIKNIPEFTDDFVNGSRNFMCGAGKTIIAIDANGDIYPCQTFIRTKYKLGNILESNWYEEFEKNVQKEKIYNTNILKKEKCKVCEYKFLCLGGCPNLSYRVYGDINHSNDFMCELYKKNARKFLLSLFEGK